MIKPGVQINGVQPEIVLAILVAKDIWERNGYEYTCTSLLDGQHSPGSLHYAGLAFDSRTWEDDQGTQMGYAKKQELADQLKNALGSDWDVVVEATHIHTELDVKGKRHAA